MLNNSSIKALLFIFLIVTASCNSGTATEDTKDSESDTSSGNDVEEAAAIPSPRKQAKGKIGKVEIVVDYGSPAVKGRTIWGGLEEYGKVWRAGANETTSIELGQDVIIGDKKVDAGKYGLYIIPNEAGDWVIIINKDWSREKHGAWGAYNYNEKNDVVRLMVTPEWANDNRERLEYSVVDAGVKFAWEKVRLLIPIEGA